jgi:hypothetical protein
LDVVSASVHEVSIDPSYVVILQVSFFILIHFSDLTCILYVQSIVLIFILLCLVSNPNLYFESYYVSFLLPTCFIFIFPGACMVLSSF